MNSSAVSHLELLELLQRGEAAEVYRARDERTGEIVAVEIFAAVQGAEEAAERLRCESRAAAELGHPHICTVLEVGSTPDGGLFLVRELCEETLRSRIARGPLTLEQAVGLASQIAAALGRAHEKGLVHRDLRPSNILLTADGQARVAGFGIANIANIANIVGSNGSSPVSALAYRSPEQLRGGAVDACTDIWSLGVLLHEMVTGRLPFRGADRSALIAAILEAEPEPMADVHPGVPAELEAAVSAALAKEPEGRPARMDDFLVALRGILAGGRLARVEATLVQVPGLRTARTAEEEPAEPRVVRDSDLEGTAVAHYRILESLGSGAMGKVYKAEDTLLRRTVALKLLPPELTRDPVSKARFLQEAQAASALDHANICTIHEIGETRDGRLYLAMAGYDGETLRTRIARGPLPIAEAMEIARQTALGLAKAHRHGIVHRDIKPANLMITGDGAVKILDFGVAKLRGEAGFSVAGSFLGTPAYMSPEQARGEEVDQRADVWSLGVVLYEMLAGTRPFHGGEDLTAVLRSLLEDRPAPLRGVRRDAPAELERIVARMLARSPADRYPGAEAVLEDLTALQRKLTRPAASRRRAVLWAAGGVAAVLLLALAGFLLSRRVSEPRPVQPVFTRITDDEGREISPSLSPAGQSLAYVRMVGGQTDIFLRDLRNGLEINLTEGSPDDDGQPAFSPDGRWIAFRSERDRGGLYVVPAEGGPARRVSDLGYDPAWSPDGRELAAASEGIIDPNMRRMDSELWLIDVATGRRRRLLDRDGVQPSWSPHGSRIAYWGLPEDSAQRVLWTIPVTGGKPEKLLDDGHLNWNPVWSPDGRYLYFGSDRSGSLNLWRMPIDEASGRALEEPEPVTIPATASGFWSLSRDGRRIAYAANESKSNVESLPFDPERLLVTGRGTPVTRGSNLVHSCDVSPDGRWIAFDAAAPQEDLFVVRTDGNGLRQLTDDGAKDRHPFWSPDGRRFLFYSNRDGDYAAWTIRREGGSPERVLPPGGEPLTFPLWSPDGWHLACTYGGKAAMIDLGEPLEVRRPQLLPPASAQGETFYPYSWSADGERIAGNISRADGSNLEGIGVYFVRTRTYQRWTSRGTGPVWLRDSRRLLYTEAGKILAFDTRTNESRDVLAPPASSVYMSVSASPDNRQLFAVRAVDEGDIWLLTLSVDRKKSSR